MQTLVQDLKYAVRTLRKSPAIAGVMVAVLALGIGANTAIFSLANALMLRPLPFPDADRLMVVWEDVSWIGFPRNTPAPANYVDWKSRNQVFEDMAALQYFSFNLTGEEGEPERVTAIGVTASFFPLLGVKPLLGRTLGPEADQPDAHVAVLSHGLWERRFAGDPKIVGRDIALNGVKYTVAGVMPAGFSFPRREVEVYAPIGLSPQRWSERDNHFLEVVGRLKPGITLRRARADMEAIAARLARDYPDSNMRIGVVVSPLREEYLLTVRTGILVLLGAVGCVLLIACANVANLLLARATARRREIAVRAALGAGRWRVVRQLLTESLLLALAGGAAGLALARASFSVMAKLVPAAMPDTAALRLDWAALGFTMLIAAAAGILFGLAPAWGAVRVDLNEALKQGGRTGSGGGKRTRDWLVIGETALAVVLLTGAGLLIQTLARLRGVELGFRPEGVLTALTLLPPASYQKNSDRMAFANKVLDRVRALPGVTGAGYANSLPLVMKGNTRGFWPEGHAPHRVGEIRDANFRKVTPDYLQTMGIALQRGRYLRDSDGDGAKLVAVINDTMARQFWPHQDPVGRRFKFGGPDADEPWVEIVGIVAGVRQMGLELPPRAEVYVPMAQAHTAEPDSLVIRTTSNPIRLAAAVRAQVREVDPRQPVSIVRTMGDIVDEELGPRKLQMTLLGALAGLALLLASIGIFGVLHFAVTQRFAEIGVRVALGAGPGDVARMVVGQGLRLAGIGVAIGIAGALAVTRMMSSMLFGVKASDPLAFAGAAIVLLAVAAVASWAPARRAARVDPVVALRAE
ncbi:MAG: ABC transporter permease [Acidobacteriota bacterium]|nr:ABC transporter permease [Acidobacteriota bacterium]